MKTKWYETKDAFISNFVTHPLIKAVLSSPFPSDEKIADKVIIRPILVKGIVKHQWSYFFGSANEHKNYAVELSLEMLWHDYVRFKQTLIITENTTYQFLIGKKKRIALVEKQHDEAKNTDFSHNRQKNYIIPEGNPIPFLIELGVMNHEGKIYPKMQDKFRQINHFLEVFQNAFDKVAEYKLNANDGWHFVDFGCGKSYLTFSLYYFLTEIKKQVVSVVGIDLKEDMIQLCKNLAEKLNYKNLTFFHGKISDYQTEHKIDGVIALHACDTATDAALTQALKWNVSLVLVAPCCQQEMHHQVENHMLTPLLKYPLLKERFSAIATDALRAYLLEIAGYKVQVVEFVDFEHTPKNIMIQAVKKMDANDFFEDIQRKKAIDHYLLFKRELHIDPALERMAQKDLHLNQ